MKRILLFSVLTALFMGCFVLDVDAQFRRKKKKKKKKPQDEYFDESGSFTQNLWYGGGGTLRFNGFNGNSAFAIGLSPMAAYKFDNIFSAGLRLETEYYFEKINDFGNAINYESFSWGAGPFTRAKVWQLFFHGEFLYQNFGSPYDETDRARLDPDDPNKLQTFRYTDEQVNVGLGYSSGGLLAYEIYVLYDVLSESTDQQSPWDVRFGLTYRF